MSRLTALKEQVKELEVQIATLEALKTFTKEKVQRFAIDIVTGNSDDPGYTLIDFEDSVEIKELGEFIIGILERRVG